MKFNVYYCMLIILAIILSIVSIFIHINKEGPQGQRGPQGPQGPQAPLKNREISYKNYDPIIFDPKVKDKIQINVIDSPDPDSKYDVFINLYLSNEKDSSILSYTDFLDSLIQVSSNASNNRFPHVLQLGNNVFSFHGLRSDSKVDPISIIFSKALENAVITTIYIISIDIIKY